MGVGTTIVGGSDADRAVALRRALTARGHEVAPMPWPPGRIVSAYASWPDATAIVLDGLLEGMTLRTIAETVERRPSLGFVAVGPLEPDIEVLIALASGVSSYLPTGSDPDSVADAVDALACGEVMLPRSISLPLVAQLHCDGLGITVERRDGNAISLTRREWEILVLARQGHTTAEMAERLVVSKVTVRTHLAALVHKLDLPARAALARPLTVSGVEKDQRLHHFHGSSSGRNVAQAEESEQRHLPLVLGADLSESSGL